MGSSMSMQGCNVMSNYYELLCSFVVKCVGHQATAQHALLPALQCLVTSLGITANAAAEAAKRKGPTDDLQLWIRLLDSMLGHAIPLQTKLPAMRKLLMPLPGLVSPYALLTFVCLVVAHVTPRALPFCACTTYRHSNSEQAIMQCKL